MGLRRELLAIESPAQRRRVFEDSPYWRHWFSLLSSPAVAKLAQTTGEAVRLLIHPNLSRLVSALELPEAVRRIDSDNISFQQELARSALLLTDYSSIAFDAAYLDLPVVYYQFDRESMFSGQHPLRVGYFDYDRDAFGPIALTEADAQRLLLDQVEGGFTLAEPYARRVRQTFPNPDTANRARIVAAVEQYLQETEGR
jgi:CDP-glycerol glycerophosphotransferase (TagB/SpsB family)